MSSEFNTLARLFAGNTNVNIVFETGKKAIPRTDGRTIYLPQDLGKRTVYPTLSALLHESHHIKLSGMQNEDMQKLQRELGDFIMTADSRRTSYAPKADGLAGIVENLNKQVDNIEGIKPKRELGKMKSSAINAELIFNCINCLEDVRIDNKIFDAFCNARYLYKFLINASISYSKSKKADDTANIQIIIPRIFQYIYLKGVGYLDSFVWQNCKTFIEDRFGEVIDEILDETIGAEDIKELRISVLKLLHIIDDLMSDEEYAKSQLPEVGKKLQEEIDEQSSKISKKTERCQKRINEAESAFDKELKNYEKLKNEREKLSIQGSDLYTKLSKERKSPFSDSEYKEIRKKIDQLTNEVRESYKKQSTARRNTNNKLRQLSRVAKDVDALKAQLERVKDFETRVKIGDASAKDLCKSIPGINQSYESLNDFKALNNSKDYFQECVAPMHNFESSLEVIFSRLKNVDSYSPNSGYFNVNKAYKIFDSTNETNLKDLFKYSSPKRVFKNKVAFIMDISGSMFCGSRQLTGRKNNFGIMMDVSSSLFKVVENKKEDYNIEYALFAYNENIYRVKDYENNIDEQVVSSPEKLADLFRKKSHLGGGTHIINAIKKVKNHLEDNAHPNDNTFIVVITDAEFSSEDCEKILEKYNYEKDKIIFIGIDKDNYRGQRIERALSAEGTTQDSDYYVTERKFYEKILMKRFVKDAEGLEKSLLEGFSQII